MKKNKIHFGYEIETGKEIEIPISHTVITGLTNESGKTTAVMGLIKRSGLRAIIIKTKIGEKAITEGAIIPPFYKETFDWEYASELLEASRKEKLKFERSWIIRYSKTATNLLEFKKNIDNALAEGKLRELDKSVLISLQAYLDKIIPELQYAPLSHTLDIKDGINIMDLERFKEETQEIIIKSILEEVLNKEKNTLVIIPECWKYLPEKLGNPVKRPAEAFIRQGATNNNFLFLDSQDITGVSKTILKQVSNWILGYQTEINEIKRTLEQIPLSKKLKPNPEDIATLKKGNFFVATSEFVKKCYSQPSWLDDKTAKKVALGKIKVEDLEQPAHIAPYQIVQKQETIRISEEKTIDYSKRINELREDFISNRNDFFNKFQQINETISLVYKELFNLKNQASAVNEDEIVMRVLQKIPVTQVTPKTNQSVTDVNFDKESIIKEILARVPKAGAVTYKIAPLEKIKKDFLEEAKNKILSDIETLNDKEKKMLKYIESQGKGIKGVELIKNCFLWKEGGSQRSHISQFSKSLLSIEVIKKDAGGVMFPLLKERIKFLLETKDAKPEEIENVYNHIMMEMLK
ncbi:MAG: ATP-binding protein [Proteobacteria bacterium]|nr:ATP-binding protein [Pseudomonadota bacterium]